MDLKGEDFLCDELICPEIISSTRLAYYRDLGMGAEAKKAERLSCRERQCLRLLIEEKTAKETASILGLSRRTVEYYFENIKNKLSCWSKKEILSMARAFEELGLL